MKHKWLRGGLQNGEAQPVPLLRHILDFLEDINNAKRETQKVTKVLSYMEELHRPAPSPPSSVDEDESAAADVEDADDISEHRASFSDEEEEDGGGEGSELDEDEDEDDVWSLDLEDDIPLTARDHRGWGASRALFTPRVGRSGAQTGGDAGKVPQLQLQAVMRGLAAGAMSARSQLQQHQLGLPGGWLSAVTAARAAAGDEGQQGFAGLPSLSRTRRGNDEASSCNAGGGGERGDGVGTGTRGNSRLGRGGLESISDDGSDSESYGLGSSDLDDQDLCSGDSDDSDGGESTSDGEESNSDGGESNSDGGESDGSLGNTVAAAVAGIMESDELEQCSSCSVGSHGPDGGEEEVVNGQEERGLGGKEGSSCSPGRGEQQEDGAVTAQLGPLLSGLPGGAVSEGLELPGAESSWGSEASCQKQEGQAGGTEEASGEQGLPDHEGFGVHDIALDCTSRCSSSSSLVSGSDGKGGIGIDGMVAGMASGDVEGGGSSEVTAGDSCREVSKVNEGLQQFTLLLQEGPVGHQIESPASSPAGRGSHRSSPASSPGLRKLGPWSPARGSPAGSRGSTKGSPLGSGTSGSCSKLSVPAGEGGLPWEVPGVKCRLWPGGCFPQPDFEAEGGGK